jgi:hypothetical protein
MTAWCVEKSSIAESKASRCTAFAGQRKTERVTIISPTPSLPVVGAKLHLGWCCAQNSAMVLAGGNERLAGFSDSRLCLP